MFSMGTKVRLTGAQSDITGVVVGFATYQSAHYATMHPGYCLRLDKGFWVKDDTAFLDTILVSADSVEEIE